MYGKQFSRHIMLPEGVNCEQDAQCCVDNFGLRVKFKKYVNRSLFVECGAETDQEIPMCIRR